MRKPYASDISREKFEAILPLLQSVRKRTQLTTVDLYDVYGRTANDDSILGPVHSI